MNTTMKNYYKTRFLIFYTIKAFKMLSEIKFIGNSSLVCIITGFFFTTRTRIF